MKDFIDAINSARSSDLVDPIAPLDNTPVFRTEPKSPIRGKTTEFGPSINCDGHSRVFVLWRPWPTCHRCIRGLEHGTYELPDTGDHECPHTMNGEFETVLNQGLRGEILFQTQEYFTLQDGTRCCHLVWLTTNGSATEIAQKRQEVRDTFTPIHSERLAEMKKEALEASESTFSDDDL